MDIKLTQPAEIAIRTLPDDDRSRLMSWLEHLKGWPKDESVRANVRRLPGENGEELYVLRIGGELRVAFSVKEDAVSILDIFCRDALKVFGQPAH